MTAPGAQAICSADPLDAAAGGLLCARLAATMDSLIETIERETALVRKGRLSDATAIQVEKARLAKQYVEEMDTVKVNSAALGRLVPEQIEKLRRKHGEFQSLLQINLAVLATAREVSEDIIRSVAQRVGAHERARTYGDSGRMPKDDTASASGIALDTSL